MVGVVVVKVIVTCQRRSGGGDRHGHDHADGGHAVPEHADADAEGEERQAALEDHVHGQAEPPQRPERQRGLEGGQDADRSELLRTQDTIWDLGSEIWDLESGTWDLGPGIWDLGSGTWNLESGTWYLGFGIWDLGPGTCNLEPATWNLESSTWNLGPGI